MANAKLEGAVRIPTYNQLTRIATASGNRQLNLAIVVGRPGVAKSRTIRAAIPHACWIEGNMTAFGAYRRLYENRDRTVVIDDVDAVYSNKSIMRLLKSLCQTERQKTVSWTSNATGSDELPAEFTTTSNVFIISNDWKMVDADTRALADRGHLLYFDPSPNEVHARVASWFWDREVYLWFGSRLRQLPDLSMRQYIKAAELKQAGLDWRAHALSHIPPSHQVFVEVSLDPTLRSEAERVATFCASTGMSRATYFNLKQRIGGRNNTSKLTGDCRCHGG